MREIQGLTRLEHGRSVTRNLRLSISYSHFVWQLVFYAVPIALLICISMWRMAGYGMQITLSLENYLALLRTPRYAAGFRNSILLGICTGTLSTGLALPLAYGLRAHVSSKPRAWLLLGLMLPFLSSFVLRMFGWQSWVNNQGILVWVVRCVPRWREASGFLFTPMATVVGLLSVLLPVATVFIFLSLARVHPDLVLAARNLGARRWQAFRWVEFHFVLPAILVAFLFSFLVAFGDTISPSILGGNRTYYFSAAIQDQTKIGNWPLAAAIGTVMLLVSSGMLAAIFSLGGRTTIARMQQRMAGSR